MSLCTCVPSKTDCLASVFENKKAKHNLQKLAQSKSLKVLQSPLKLSLRTALHCAAVYHAASQMAVFKEKKELEFFQVLDFYTVAYSYLEIAFIISPPTLERVGTTRGKARLCHVVYKSWRRGSQNNRMEGFEGGV